MTPGELAKVTEDAKRWRALRRIAIQNGSVTLSWSKLERSDPPQWEVTCGSILNPGGEFDWLATDCKTADDAIDAARAARGGEES